ncbi:helix-turn-helix transcriptional regulator [bacterium]|nr:helix-turn-helix transcriptional regulator [bacterium]
MGSGIKNKVTTLAIKNMVCDRCIRVVRDELANIGVNVRHVELGKAIVEGNLTLPMQNKLRMVLTQNGFELLEDKRAKIVEEIKNQIVIYVQKNDVENKNIKLSVLLSRTIGRDYSYLSGLFSSVEGITIERFLILQKIEKVKEWLAYDDRTLSEISYKLGYSSVPHLSKQFKQITGLTPTEFKQQNDHRRIPLDKIKMIHRVT